MVNIKKILIVTWSYPPINGPRAIKSEAIVEELIRLGHEVSLISRGEIHYFNTSLKNQLKQLIPMSLKPWPIFTYNLKKSEYWNFHKILRVFNGLLLRFINYPEVKSFWLILGALKKTEQKQFDLCISIDGPQPIHWAVAYARKRKMIDFNVWIADCGDPLARSSRPGNNVASYFKLLEDYFCRIADFVTVPVKEGYTYFNQKFESKIRVVEHSLTFPAFDIIQSQKKPKPSSIVHFAYAGNMSPYQQQTKELFKALSTIDQNFKFHIYGGNEELVNSIIDYNEQLSNKVVLHGAIDRHILLKKIIKHDFLIYFPYPGTGQIPFKLIDYAFTQLPILEFSTMATDKEKLLNFLSKIYKEKKQIINYEKYSSKYTVKKYLDLANAK